MYNVKVGICQMKVVENKNINLNKAEEMIRNAANNDAKIIVLPEMFNCPYSNKYFTLFSESYPDKTTNLLSSLAKELNVYIIGGSIPEKYEDKVYNTSYIFDKNGNIIDKHRKMHLFDVEIENGIVFKESDTLDYGNKVTVVDTEYGKIGVAICYDMRFPELMRLMAVKGAKIIIVPAAFNMTTGPVHWHLLARSRALDNQVYFLAASPARDNDSIYVAFGHSIIVNPWGEVMVDAKENECIVYGDLDLSKIDKIRSELPLLKHRRSDLYSLDLK